MLAGGVFFANSKKDYLAAAAILFFLLMARPPVSTLFPYTTLFRSSYAQHSYPSCRFLNLPFMTSSRSEEHTSELQSHSELVCRLLLEKKKWRRSEDAEHARGHAADCGRRPRLLGRRGSRTFHRSE